LQCIVILGLCLLNGTLIDSPLLQVDGANKRERALLGIITSKTKESNSEYIFVCYTESKMDGTDVYRTSYCCVPGTAPIANRLY
jgi:hypothetical protein